MVGAWNGETHFFVGGHGGRVLKIGRNRIRGQLSLLVELSEDVIACNAVIRLVISYIGIVMT